VDEALRTRLLAMRERDLATRARLAETGALFEGYNPEMREVHEANADALAQIIAERGWPGASLVGQEGAEAAWLIVQHAISRPEFCRRCLSLLREAAAQGEAPAWQAAYLEDRIRVLEGRPQLYGTSFDWDEEGLMSPLPIENPEQVDDRRRSVGLGPLSEATAKHRRSSLPEPKPGDLARRRAEKEAWAAEAGWR
jgi:hypothetical protein